MEASNKINVLIRCRPFLQNEEGGGDSEKMSVDAQSSTIRLDTKNGITKEFAFDKVFDGSVSQEAVYVQGGFAQSAKAVMKGYNSTIFAYGQTGTGKTYTMQGKENPSIEETITGGERGIVPRIVHDLFRQARDSHGDNVHFSCSFVQVYMEQAFDLLQSVGRAKPKSSSQMSPRPRTAGQAGLKNRLRLRWSKEKEFYLENMRTFDCPSPQEVFQRFEQGVANRKVASHKLNIQSSRSHSIFMINVDRPGDVKGDRVKSTLMLVDLAGSERVSHTGSNTKQELLRESIFINKSLLTLRKVIYSLAKNNKRIHIPFRDSTLTSLLKNSLGGNAYTTMIACLTPRSDFFDENLCTLEYASRTSSIVNQMVINEDPKTRIIRNLKKRVAELEGELRLVKSGMAPATAMPHGLANGGQPPAAAESVRHPPMQLPPQTLNGLSSLRNQDNFKHIAGGERSSDPTRSMDYEELAVDTQDANEALMVENADLREQLKFIQAIVTMEDSEGGAPVKAKNMHTVESALFMELYELRRENESMREYIQRLEFDASRQSSHKHTSSRSSRTMGSRTGRLTKGSGRKHTSSKSKTGMLTVEELKGILNVPPSVESVLQGNSLRVTTTGNIVSSDIDEGEGRDAKRGNPTDALSDISNGGVDPLEQLNKLLAERNALGQNSL